MVFLILEDEISLVYRATVRYPMPDGFPMVSKVRMKEEEKETKVCRLLSVFLTLPWVSTLFFFSSCTPTPPLASEWLRCL
jgi:hypothetical protein